GQVNEFPIFIHVEGVFDADAKIFVGNVDARLNGEYLSRPESLIEWTRIVNVESNAMAQSVNEVLAQRLALQTFPVRVDVIVGGFVQGVGVLGVELGNA